MSDPHAERLESALTNGPALPKQPGPGNGGDGSDATPTLLSPQALAYAAAVLEAQRLAGMKDKSYRATPIGGEVGRFLRSLRWEDAAENTLLSYETTLARFAQRFAHVENLADLDLDRVECFLQDEWGDAAPATRRQRLAAVRSFFRWAVEKGRAETNPVENLRPPKGKSVERQAYAPDLIDSLRDAQPTLRDQIAIQLLGRLALRKNELRLLQVRDFDLTRGTVRVQGKGGKVVVLPLGFEALKRDLEVYLVGRGEAEYLLFPKTDTSRPMTSVGVHLWFKRCLKVAGLPDSVKMHEMRHSAADNLWRQTGNMTLAQQLLRHESPATTAGYLHPTRDDLSAALASLEQVVTSGEGESA